LSGLLEGSVCSSKGTLQNNVVKVSYSVQEAEGGARVLINQASALGRQGGIGAQGWDEVLKQVTNTVAAELKIDPKKVQIAQTAVESMDKGQGIYEVLKTVRNAAGVPLW
jgi:hypothetical protein